MSRHIVKNVTDEGQTDRAGLAAAAWKQVRPDLDTFPMELIGRLGEAAHVIARDHLTPFFAEHGLQNGEFDVLATLRRASAPHALTPTALYEAAMMSSGGMTARIDRLEKAGFIERRKHPSDRRGTLVVLTSEGLARIDRLLPAHVENERATLSALSSADQRSLNVLLAKLLMGLGTDRK